MKLAERPEYADTIRQELVPLLRQFRPGKFKHLESIGPSEELFSRGYHETSYPLAETSIHLKPVVPGVIESYDNQRADIKTVLHELVHELQMRDPDFMLELSSGKAADFINKYYGTGALKPDYTRIRTFIERPQELTAETMARHMVAPASLESLPIDIQREIPNWFEKYRSILAPLLVGGSLGASLLAGPDEAEAFKVTKMKPLTPEIFKASEKGYSGSSAADFLKGKIIQGLEIIDVITKGKGPDRFAILRDPKTNKTFQWHLDKEAVSTLSAMKGYEEYMGRFKALGKDKIGKAEQALTSMDTRIEKGLTGTLKDVQPFTEAYMTKTYNLSPTLEPSLEQVPDLVFVNWKGQTMHLPRWYADFLEYTKKKPFNKWIERELQDFKVLKTEPKFYKDFAKGGEFDLNKTYQYGVINKDGSLSFSEGTGEELNYWFSSVGMKKQAEEGIKILRLEDLKDFIENLGGIA